MGQFEELSDFNKYFPIFYEGGEDPEPVGIPIAPGIETPSYSLGWMVRSPGIGKLHVDYTVAREKIILPNWSAHNCIPKDLNVMGNYGLIVPDIMAIGMDYVFIRIADNNPFIIKALRSERDRSHLIIRQAMVVLGLLDDPNNSTDPTVGLIWVRGDAIYVDFPKVDFPCKWSHRWPLFEDAMITEESCDEDLAPLPASLRDIIEFAYLETQ
ncbi:hypothetical protein DFP72DRAFT_1066473 [Ephemerocybe angulata]|uniref:Uncharacterized protein n=1 Tax=Ephemerocybe angulata TaxID=980116 RepID=A0A8H6M928_9AGAR|nr:hypothetical protein DFP72DRAFT_1066473 [Tulosesus angulatus]